MFKIKPLFCILIIILLSSCATTKVWVDKDQIKENESVAFIGFDIKNVLTGQYSNSIDNQVSDGLSIFFLENNFVVIERIKIDKVIKEVEFQQSGVTDQETAVALGKLINADYVIIGSGNYQITGKSPFIQQFNMKMINVETGSIALITTYRGSGVHLGLTIEKIGTKISKELKKKKT